MRTATKPDQPRVSARTSGSVGVIPAIRLDASAEEKPERVLWLRGGRGLDLGDRLFVVSGGAQRHCVRARFPYIGVRIQPQSGRELRRRLVEML